MYILTGTCPPLCNTCLRVQSLEGQLEVAKTRATQGQHDRVEAARQELFMEVISRK